VVDAFRRTADHLRVLRVRSAGGAVHELRTTDEHPFWVPSRGWVPAGQLAPGDHPMQEDGQWGSVTATAREPHPEGVPVFNLKVEGLHTYFAAGQPGSPFLLVHNAPCAPESGPPRGVSSAEAPNTRPQIVGTAKPPTTGGVPNSVYTQVNAAGEAIQNAIYDPNGNVIGHVDFKPHGPGAPSGHGHTSPKPGDPSSGHGPGAPHILPSDLPPGWGDLLPGVKPYKPIGATK
jgi:hypothetical protein